MTKKFSKYLLLLLVSALLTACAKNETSLRVGSKNFAESMILAEMIAQVAENAGIAVERKIPFGNTQKIMEGAKQDILDVYPEYNGTGLIFLGQAPISDGDASTEKVRELFRPLGLELKSRFGFSNDYAIVMTKERAAELGVKTIGDLTNSSAAVNFAVDEDFSTRAADGLGPMIRRYGINQGNTTIHSTGSEGKDKIVADLLDGTADVAELFATDGQIAEYNLVVLEDNLKFFPVYEVAPLVRKDALTRIPELDGVFGKLAGIISASDMQAMNKAVDIYAQTPASVATAFLISKGLLPEGSATTSVQNIVVAADPSVVQSSDTAKALRSIRVGFPGSNLEIRNNADPIAMLADGTARVAMVGAEAFFNQTETGPVSKNNAVAFAVLGFKSGHLLVSRNSRINSIKKMKKISTAAEGSGSALVLDILLKSTGQTGTMVVNSDQNLAQQTEALINGDVDGVFVMAPQGDRVVSQALHSGGAKLIALDEWSDGGYTAIYSFIRPSTIPAKTYGGQYDSINTLSTQTVLASAVQQQQTTGDVGPGTVGSGNTAVPVTGEVVQAINSAIGTGDLIDPAIPVHGSLIPSLEVVDNSLPFSIDISIVNVLMLIFTIWVLYLVSLPSPKTFTMPDEK